MNSGLACSNASVRFGAFTALDAISVDFAPNLLHGVIGPNGAGKTTLINALSGLQTLTTGRVLLNGRDITALPAHRRAHLGIGRSFQITKTFPTMTVFENLRLAGQASRFDVQPFWRSVTAYRRLAAAAEEMLDFIGLRKLRDVIVGQLAHGDQRALEVGLTLMGNPSIVLLDEPLAGVGQQEVDRAVDLMRRMREGRTVILIEHNMKVMMALADRIVVMARGALLATGTPDEVRADARVRAIYLGEDEDAGA
ncbi:MAG: ABC transporter ATP-binding protein [Burkholderiaceae bacterium]